MRFLSLFSGIEAASVAWCGPPLSWTCVGVAEIEPFPAAVLAHHYPEAPNLGNIQKITEADIKALGHIDLVVFGFPCQDLSVAGKRAGLKGERSGLFYDAMRIVRWSGARWAVAENVPGLFSTHRGRDFAAVVGEMVGASFDVPPGGWETCGAAAGPDGMVEWSVLDAQWWGVAQRRRRVFLVRDIGDWANRPPVLFERESLSGHPAPSREAREGTSSCVAPSLTASNDPSRSPQSIEITQQVAAVVEAMYPDVIGTLSDGAHNGGGLMGKTPTQDELSRCLNAGGMGRQDWETETLVIHARD